MRRPASTQPIRVQVSPLGIAGICSVTLLVLGFVSISSLVDRRFTAQTSALVESEFLKRELEKVVDELEKSEDRLRVLIETIPALAWTAELPKKTFASIEARGENFDSPSQTNARPQTERKQNYTQGRTRITQKLSLKEREDNASKGA